MEVIPGDIAQTIAGRGAPPEAVAAVRAQLGLDQPAVARYVDWLGGLPRADFGESISLHADVASVLFRAAQNSLVLAACAALIGLPLAISLGFIAGLQRPRWIDPVISRVALVIGSLPEFLIALLLILVFGQTLGWFPLTSLAGGSPLANPSALVLPVMTLVLSMAAYNLRVTRASVVRVREMDFVVAAEVKSLPLRTIVRRHVAPNALLPTITVAASYVGWMIGGLVVIEAVFAYPGLGLLILNAAKAKDVPLLEGAALLVATVRLFVNLGADITYRLLDPRVRIS
jgi:peptide/nickel transport system permease protein